MNPKMIALGILLISTAFRCNKDKPADIPQITTPEVSFQALPLFPGQNNEGLVQVKFVVTADETPLILTGVVVRFSDNSRLAILETMEVQGDPPVSGSGQNILLGTITSFSASSSLTVKKELGTGMHFIRLSFRLKKEADLASSFGIKEIALKFANHPDLSLPMNGTFRFRPAIKLRAAGQDNCNTYRIPGLVTTSKGTLIAVYDNRYNNSKDLQEDIDIGMSRSTDGGQTWEPMKVIMDMGEYGDRSQRLNGCGDPSILYDHVTHTIWVAALWMSGSSPDQMLWWASKPGMAPEETGQFLLVKSTDDGLTWSAPINITSQIKNPGWQLLLQGPGRGITLKDGTLVFPAQYKADIGAKALDGGQYTCHSTIVYSKDAGLTWQIGTGAKSNTTEAQVVELADGSLMLNMRDDRNRSDKGDTNGRAVAVTKDFGKTWTFHPSSNSALPESNCMASLIAADVTLAGKKQQVLFFSNPNSKTERSYMTIKASMDGGLTWPEKYYTLLNSASGYGYSCMTMTGENTIGILYEGTKDLLFQKLDVSELQADIQK